MGIFNFLKADTFKSWKDVRNGLTCLDTDRYRKQLAFLLRTGLANNLTPGELQAIEHCLNEAVNGNINDIKNLPEPKDSTVTKRLSNWLDRVYNGDKKIRLPAENTPLSTLVAFTPIQSISNIEKVFEFTARLTGGVISPGLIVNAATFKGDTWREMLAIHNTRIWLITDQILYPEDALCIPEMASALKSSSIALVHWKRTNLTLINPHAVIESMAIPPSQSLKSKLNIEEIKNKLLSNGWQISEE